MRGKKNMHREIQIKQFPIVTTHWWPKTRNERLCEKTNSIYIVFTSCTQPCPSEMRCAQHIRCVTCVCVCDVCVRALTEGVSEAWCWGNCHRSCRFWTVYSRIMMTREKKKESYYDEALHVSVSFICNSASTLDGGRVWSVVLLKKYLNCLTVLLYTVMYIPLVQMMAL